MTRGELKRIRLQVKISDEVRKVKAFVRGERFRSIAGTVAEVMLFIAFMGLLGSVGGIETSEGFPKASVGIMIASLMYMVSYAVWKGLR